MALEHVASVLDHNVNKNVRAKTGDGNQEKGENEEVARVGASEAENALGSPSTKLGAGGTPRKKEQVPSRNGGQEHAQASTLRAKKIPDIVGEKVERGTPLRLLEARPSGLNRSNKDRRGLDKPGPPKKGQASLTPQPTGKGPEVSTDPGEERQKPETPAARARRRRRRGRRGRTSSGARSQAASGSGGHAGPESTAASPPA